MVGRTASLRPATARSDAAEVRATGRRDDRQSTSRAAPSMLTHDADGRVIVAAKRIPQPITTDDSRHSPFKPLALKTL